MVIHYRLFETQVERTPEAVALVFEAQQLTYRDLNSKANQLAHYLRTLGVGPDILVGICVERSLDMVVGLLGIQKAGGAFVALSPSYPQERLALILSDTQVPVILTQEKLVTRIPQYQGHLVCLDRGWQKIAAERASNPVSEVQPENLAYVTYTSGSTGKPKGVMMTHQSIGLGYQWLQEIYPIDSRDRVLQKVPICFSVFTWEIFWPLMTGAQIVLAKPDGHRDPAYLVKLIAQEQITIVYFIPSLLRIFLEEQGLETCSSLRLVFSTGEMLPFALKERFFERLRECELHDVYGSEEDFLATNWHCQPGGAPRRFSLGRPISKIPIYILDEQLQPVPTGEVGELHTSCSLLAKGYLNRPELTAQKFIPNPFENSKFSRLYKTGDLARYLPDGNIELLGRLDNRVKIGSYRVELGEIEAVLSQHPAIKQAVVVVREDIPDNKRLVSYVVPAYLSQQSEATNNEQTESWSPIGNETYKQPAAEQLVTELRNFLKKQLPDYMIPSVFMLLETLPLTSNGKVDRRSLPALDQSYRTLEVNFVAPRDELELQLTKIWEKVLDLQPIGIKDNFFHLGGHSLLSVRLFSEIEKAYQQKIPLTTLLAAPTVEELAQVIGQENDSIHWSPLVAIQPGFSKPPWFFIHAGGGGGMIQFRNLSRYMGSDQPFYGIDSLGLYGETTCPPTIEEMATLYLKEIRAVQPEGPYFLGGLCLGGLIAYEIAQQLYEQDDEIGLLVLFNTLTPNGIMRIPVLKRFSDHILNLFKEGPDYVIKKYQGKIKQIKNQNRRKKSLEKSNKIYLKSSQSTSEAIDYKTRRLVVGQIHNNAYKNYVPKPYSGNVTLFQTQGDLRPPEGYYNDSQWGWGKLVKGELEIHIVPGRHSKVLVEPHIKLHGEKLRDCIERSQTKPPVNYPLMG
ncbi:MAG: amino acid adenylation domain-containing protein [Xenococcus sp. MO_188.B8]|nr:amino acid adenylation domain-containing protein [Xenococcus sp. MO_188.B8]